MRTPKNQNNWVVVVSYANRFCDRCGGWIVKGQWMGYNKAPNAQTRAACMPCHRRSVQAKIDAIAARKEGGDGFANAVKLGF